MEKTLRKIKRAVALFTLVWISLLSPVSTLAAETDAVGNETGAPDNTGAPTCTGNGCGQGTQNGLNNGGPTPEELGAVKDESGEWVWPDDVVNTTQGASNGTGIDASNTDTGAGSDNDINVDTDKSTTNDIDNTVTNTTNVDATALTGSNEQNKNTNADGITTGNANIGVTQVINDNTTTIGGQAGLDVSGHNGDYDGDLNLGFGAGTGHLTGENGGSIRAINDGTGYDSDNDIDIDTQVENLNEVQNDGLIDNLLDLAAITGQNEASMNTGDGSITTGDANISATLVNLLNTTVINGDLWLTVADIFGDLNGNVVLPDFATLAAAAESGDIDIEALNETTGSDSDNDIDIDIDDEEVFEVGNDADINTVVNADAITGDNETLSNTGGGSIDTGNASVSASNLTLANTTVEGGNWGLVVVSALNRWLGFMVGDSGEVIALSQEDTIREIEAHNGNTGAESDNNIDIDLETDRENSVVNDAVINNEVTAMAITGQNEASKNTGQGDIETGDANVGVTAVNIANTTVKDGSLFVAVVNVFGDWWGDLMYDGTSLASAAGTYGDTVTVDATNAETGSDSENNIDVDVDRSHETEVNNDADVETILNANVDTGNNKANRNTKGADIETGDGLLSLHSRTIANLTGIAIDPVLGLQVNGLNDTTGFDSKNKIRAKVNDERLVEVNNDANVSTIFAGGANTGDNQANMNTIGGDIVTGNIDADLSINNLINRVMLALADGDGSTFATGDDVVIDADFLNRLTGALSENSNSADVDYDFLADIMNDGFIKNLVDLLFNTGGNEQNENTLAGGTYTGANCLSGDVSNDVNSHDLGGWNHSLGIDNNADIENDINVDAQTGDNEQNKNTAVLAGSGHANDACGKIAVAPEAPEAPEVIDVPDGVGGGGDEGGNGGSGGGDEGSVSGATTGASSSNGGSGVSPKKNVLERFPVAGDVGRAMWVAGPDKVNLWPLFIAASVLLLGVAWHYDHRKKQVAELTPYLSTKLSHSL